MSAAPARDRRFLDWPFFAPAHRELAQRLDALGGAAHLADAPRTRTSGPRSMRAAARWSAQLGAAGMDALLRAAAAERRPVPLRRARPRPDPRDARLARRTGRLRLCHAGPGQRRHLAGRFRRSSSSATCPRVVRGAQIAAFALSEPAGRLGRRRLTVHAHAATADEYVLDGEKTWISNGGIADFYCVFARTSPAERARGRHDRRARHQRLRGRCRHAGLHHRQRIDLHRAASPGTLVLQGLPRTGAPTDWAPRAKASRSPCARSMSFAPRWPVPRWALRSAPSMRRCATRSRAPMFGKTLADLQLTQAALADMATEIDAARLQTYRAAWLRDRGEPVTQGGRHGQDGRDRVGAACHRPGACSCSAAAASCAGRSSSGSIARSARCASTKEPPKCRN